VGTYERRRFELAQHLRHCTADAVGVQLERLQYTIGVDQPPKRGSWACIAVRRASSRA
jgi:hypothetical protein